MSYALQTCVTVLECVCVCVCVCVHENCSYVTGSEVVATACARMPCWVRKTSSLQEKVHKYTYSQVLAVKSTANSSLSVQSRAHNFYALPT